MQTRFWLLLERGKHAEAHLGGGVFRKRNKDKQCGPNLYSQLKHTAWGVERGRVKPGNHSIVLPLPGYMSSFRQGSDLCVELNCSQGVSAPVAFDPCGGVMS